MNYRTSHYKIEQRKTNRHLKNDFEWPAGPFSIVGLALVKLQLGCVEHYPMRIQHPANKKGARPRVISFKAYIVNHRKWLINMREKQPVSWTLNVRLVAKIKICSINWFRIDSMHCISYPLNRKEGKPLLFKQTLRPRFMSLACQHFSFHTKKLLDREIPFSLAFVGRVSFFMPPTSLALSHLCRHLHVSSVLLNRLRKKRLLIV